jgi:hypothetical protein
MILFHRLKRVGSGIHVRALSNTISVKDKVLMQIDPDITNGTNGITTQSRTKLRKGLEKEDRKMHPIDIGILESMAVDITSLLNDVLEEKEFYYLFDGVKKTSDVLTIETTTLNRDCSHATVLWSSHIFKKFVNDIYSQHGQEEGRRMEQKIYTNISNKLQKRESEFRTILMRTIPFRRVPRIFFVAPGSTKALRKEEIQKKINVWARDYERKKNKAEGNATSESTSSPQNDSRS